jgi:hypothetical protein
MIQIVILINLSLDVLDFNPTYNHAADLFGMIPL